MHIFALGATLLLSFFLIRGWTPNKEPNSISNFALIADSAQRSIDDLTTTNNSSSPDHATPANESITMREIPYTDGVVKDTGAISLPTIEENSVNDTVETPAPKLTDSNLAPQAIQSAAAENGTPNYLLLAEEAFEQARYSTALRYYRLLLNSNITQEEKDIATLQAAKCYILLGSKTQAAELLKDISIRDATHEDEVRKLLSELDLR